MTSEKSKERSTSEPPQQDEIPPSILAISNLRCPSPPPILNHGTTGKGFNQSPALHELHISSPSDNGSAELIDESQPVSARLADPKSPISPLHMLQASERNDSMTSLDHILNPPKESSHHKAPSVHAHFYIDDTMKAGKVGSRSRSGSASSYARASPVVQGSTSELPRPQNGNPQSAGSSAISSQNPSKQGTPQPALGPNEQNPNIDPRLLQDDGKIHILLGVCGALSTGKIKMIISKLYEIYTPDKIVIQLILTKASENFISQEMINILENVKKVRIWRDADEWTWKARSDPVLHIELRRWADILVVCPLTANTLSKISLGICDNLLTNVIRAWNTSYPILLAPAMVSYSYNAITTKRQLKLIAEEMPWIEILKPSEKVIGSYGDIGMGGMMDWNEVVNRIVQRLGGYPKDEDEEDEDDDEEKNKETNGSAGDDDDDDDDEEEDDDEDDEDDDDDEEEDEDEDVKQDVDVDKNSGDIKSGEDTTEDVQNNEARKKASTNADAISTTREKEGKQDRVI
ncbi:Protein SIS2 [Spathaspora sp. JA1]|nr:Protein SIS2 [Spathaspora sp. JA1]